LSNPVGGFAGALGSAGLDGTGVEGILDQSSDDELLVFGLTGGLDAADEGQPPELLEVFDVLDGDVFGAEGAVEEPDDLDIPGFWGSVQVRLLNSMPQAGQIFDPGLNNVPHCVQLRPSLAELENEGEAAGKSGCDFELRDLVLEERLPFPVEAAGGSWSP
jgi:hypothetical protein